MSVIADHLMALGVEFNIPNGYIGWPLGQITQLVNKPNAAKRYRGKPLKKSVGKLLTKAVLEGREKSGCIQNTRGVGRYQNICTTCTQVWCFELNVRRNFRCSH